MVIGSGEQQVVTLRVCTRRWTEVCGGIGVDSSECSKEKWRLF